MNEKKRKCIRHILTVCLVAVMLVTGMLAAHRGANYVICYMCEQYQSYYGYLQEASETESEMMSAAQGILKNVAEYPNRKWSADGIRSIVLTDRGRYDNNGTEYSLGIEDSIENEEFFEDKKVALKYNGEEAYIKYADGSIILYRSERPLKALNDAMDLPLDSGIEIYVWVDEDYYNEQNLGLEPLANLYAYDLENIVILLSVAGCSLILAVAISTRIVSKPQAAVRIATEVPIGIMALVYLGALLVTDFFDETGDIRIYNDGIRLLLTITVGVLLLASYWALRECKLKLREKRFIKDFLIIRFLRWLGRVFLQKSNYDNFSLTKKLWLRKLLLLVSGVIYCGYCLLCGYSYEMLGLFALVLMFSVAEMNVLKNLNDVYKQIDDMAEGELVVREVNEKDVTCDITRKLNHLSEGLEDAIEKRVSSEKMKVELITNVSHDLKTPLTSIVSYVNLLKEEEMSEVAISYVKILEDKSNQLKNLVADVFDLAKANSGQDVEIEKIDGVMLIRQVLADMEDTIARSGRILKIDIRPDIHMVQGDGKKLYRALQNLIDNALKYSLEGTRIYIQSEVVEKRLKLTIKNIAAYEMNFKGEDIVERFVRGDESRTTEGSGLGLAIAKSFVEVSGGNLKVEVDGDVFKVEVEFGE